MEENGNTKVKQEAEEQGTPIIRIPRKSSNDWAEEINNKGLQIRELETKNNDMRKLMVKAKESISGLQKRNKEKDEIIGKQEIEIRKYRELIDTLVATGNYLVRFIMLYIYYRWRESEKNGIWCLSRGSEVVLLLYE